MTTERQNPSESESKPTAALQRFTRRMDVTRQTPSHDPRVPREQLAALVEALGNSEHPLHANAVDELVAIGPAAVPALCNVLNAKQAWLSSYRAAEAAGRIGDGGATGALIQTLKHPNSNVRWSAVRALAQIGDVRALLELRRVAQNDQGRTSWGESVADAAQSALSQLGQRSVWGQSIELIKTAVVAVMMILSLALAFSVVSTLRDELDRFGRVIPGQTQLPALTLPTVAPEPTVAPVPTMAPAVVVDPTTASEPAAEPEPQPAGEAAELATFTGTVLQGANIRPFPSTDNQPVGLVATGDEIVFLARTPGNDWYLIRLGAQHSDQSRIESADGTGWISEALVTVPAGELPIRE
ncbi:HEAT repeat domain-containing protein [Candidatus Viridilinea mediisalina]|uniref:Ligand-binding protein SH3 n=1 Tax=Candidatus Viridilinea mediisalina TaxID=2024553 RepID=A0A2A6RN57_9CHLR|nr:HEAT repeat domain-containing protein [Candidatus Viridilinea mediisalina]PDW04318.1 ligand-binding protein SH3 [Candidatus Viridilinea mediisalina]